MPVLFCLLGLVPIPHATQLSVSHVTLLQTITGIGRLTACWLVVVTLNFTIFTSAEALTHYAGLAPIERKSGTSVRSRPVIGHGGNSALRAMLYMAAGSAMRFNPVIQAYCERLRGQGGKAYKEARCAAARKLVHIAFAVVTKGQAFDPAYKARVGAKWDWQSLDGAMTKAPLGGEGEKNWAEPD